MIRCTNRQKSKINIFNCTGSYTHSISSSSTYNLWLMYAVWQQLAPNPEFQEVDSVDPGKSQGGPNLVVFCLGCKTGSTPLVIHLIFVCYGYAAKPMVPQSVSPPSQCGSKIDGVSYRGTWHPYGLNFWHSPSNNQGSREHTHLCIDRSKTINFLYDTFVFIIPPSHGDNNYVGKSPLKGTNLYKTDTTQYPYVICAGVCIYYA